jgi:hypothetical protein
MKTTYIKLKGSDTILAYAFTGESAICLYDYNDGKDSDIKHTQFNLSFIEERLNDTGFIQIEKSEFMLIRQQILDLQNKILESLSK